MPSQPEVPPHTIIKRWMEDSASSNVITACIAGPVSRASSAAQRLNDASWEEEARISAPIASRNRRRLENEDGCAEILSG